MSNRMSLRKLEDKEVGISFVYASLGVLPSRDRISGGRADPTPPTPPPRPPPAAKAGAQDSSAFIAAFAFTPDCFFLSLIFGLIYSTH